MEIVEGSNPQMFSFVHSHQYQQAQVQFWDAVESLNPQNIVVCIHIIPLLRLRNKVKTKCICLCWSSTTSGNRMSHMTVSP